MTDLKPCPFCGGEGKDLCSREDLYAIGCDNPLCAVEPRTAMYSSPENAQDEWNTRPASVQVDDLRGALKDAEWAADDLSHHQKAAAYDFLSKQIAGLIDQAERREGGDG